MGIRCFISVELPDELKKRIEEVISRLRNAGGDVRWVNPQNLHLTLQFLGDTDENIIPQVKEKLLDRLKGFTQFGIDIKGAGCFPNVKNPRVLWIGISISEELRNLQSLVESTMSDFGFNPDDRDFNPHLTFGRVKSPRKMEGLMKELLLQKEVSFGSVTVQAVSMMKSELSPQGSKYIRLFDIPLEKA